jgi:molybdopterin-guanine dinucleotide biosynthesis protein MobB
MVTTLQIIGFKNSGKTTIITALLQQLKAVNIRVGVLKHDHLKATMDQYGTDTAAFVQAGAYLTALQSKAGLFVHQPNYCEPDLVQLIKNNFATCDLVIIEGYKTGPYPKLVLLRPGDTQKDFAKYSRIICYACLQPHGAAEIVGLSAIVAWLSKKIRTGRSFYE